MKFKCIAVGLLLVGLSLTLLNTYYYLQGYLSVEHRKLPSPITSVSEEPPKEFAQEKQWPHYKIRPVVGEEIGELYIPRLEQVFPILEGTDQEVLRSGVGHYVKSALPGEENNTILSGHRDTVFRGLRHLKEDDELVVTTTEGQFIYKIHRIRVVEADDQTVMTPKPKATLTVTTCYPFYYLGNAPERYIISAKLIKKTRVVTWNPR